MKRLIVPILVTFFLVGCSEREIAPEDTEVSPETEESTITESITEGLVNLAITALAEKVQSNACDENPANCATTTDNVAQLVEILDGDTVVLSIPNPLDEKDAAKSSSSEASSSDDKSIEITVRFLLIDTPEMRGNNGNPQKFAPEALALTQELLENAKEIRLEFDEGDIYDKYGRVLAYIYADGVSVQEELLKSGLAKVAYAFEPNTRYLEEFKLAEEYAKINGYGLWGG